MCVSANSCERFFALHPTASAPCFANNSHLLLLIQPRDPRPYRVLRQKKKERERSGMPMTGGEHLQQQQLDLRRICRPLIGVRCFRRRRHMKQPDNKVRREVSLLFFLFSFMKAKKAGERAALVPRGYFRSAASCLGEIFCSFCAIRRGPLQIRLARV